MMVSLSSFFMITTKYFKISSTTYVRHCFFVWAEKWWWTLALPIGIFVIMGLSDARYFIVAFALALIVYPGILALLYFNYALRPYAAYALLSRRLIFSGDGIYIDYEPSEEHSVPSNTQISIDMISKIEDEGGAMIIVLKTSKYDCIIVPEESFGSGEFAKALKIISLPSKHTIVQ